VFFDPFEEYVIVPEETQEEMRRKWVYPFRLPLSNLLMLVVPRHGYVSRPQELLARDVQNFEFHEIGEGVLRHWVDAFVV
jgi:hypothetical protein